MTDNYCLGKRVVKNHGKFGLVRTCGNEAKFECSACDRLLCAACATDASRHRKKCYGGKNIDKKIIIKCKHKQLTIRYKYNMTKREFDILGVFCDNCSKKLDIKVRGKDIK